ncbi:hypothetical protein GCA01S_003_00090 [Parageobacillus caldoxylosilyticus NBRC 107762]|uniref:Uncharacterized protein n=1 Tax=Parageobacillus caldoxylosilyticus NBRC 107762 TaxID=1220594 RepID=A0A023DB53_9BACL|nr:pyridoxal phosphate-dependent aminotransferase EpsN [Parageobacillus caldoxylosilyticus]GAJ38342.1 hypothetical protein GCA01S_003_00090 [Parageobacillus caldoxylosilyticus NBRC 107762]
MILSVVLLFSFKAYRFITTFDGGMLVSDDVEALQKARFLATQARDPAPHYQHSQIRI